MTRRRGGYPSSGGMVYTVKNVYDDDCPLENESDIYKARRLSRYIMDDADVLSHKSREKDKQLMKDLTQRLENSAYKIPSYRPRYRSVIPRATPAGALYIIAGNDVVPFRPKVEENFVYNFTPYVRTRPHYVKSLPRATSEPPRYRNKYNNGLHPSAELAVRNARRYLDRIERELGVDRGEPMFEEPVVYRSHVPLVNLHHHGARRRVAASPVRSVRPRPVVSTSFRSSSVPPPSRRSKAADIETEMYLADYDEDTDTVLKRPSVRAYAPSPVTARRRMPSLDPYKPVSVDNLVTNHVPVYKPPVPRRTPGNPGNGYVLPPRTSSRPPMSDTRRRIRDVICATRHDPQYFD